MLVSNLTHGSDPVCFSQNKQHIFSAVNSNSVIQCRPPTHRCCSPGPNQPAHLQPLPPLWHAWNTCGRVLITRNANIAPLRGAYGRVSPCPMHSSTISVAKSMKWSMSPLWKFQPDSEATSARVFTAILVPRIACRARGYGMSNGWYTGYLRSGTQNSGTSLWPEILTYSAKRSPKNGAGAAYSLGVRDLLDMRHESLSRRDKN